MSEKKQILPFAPSTIETIDTAMFSWLDKEIDSHSITNKGWEKVPVIWSGQERAFQTKNYPDLRDSTGALIFPIITLERSGMVKNLGKKGMFFGNIPAIQDEQGGSIEISRRIEQEKTSNFLNADSRRLKSGTGTRQINFPSKSDKKKIVYETISIPQPIYVDVSYVVSIRTEYQQQMNQIVQPFITKPNAINYQIIKHEDHKYEAFINENFQENNNTNQLGEETRILETKISINVLGYLIGRGKNQEQPKIVKRQNFVQVKFPRENVIVGDIPNWKDGKYRE